MRKYVYSYNLFKSVVGHTKQWNSKLDHYAFHIMLRYRESTSCKTLEWTTSVIFVCFYSVVLIHITSNTSFWLLKKINALNRFRKLYKERELSKRWLASINARMTNSQLFSWNRTESDQAAQIKPNSYD